MTQTFKDLPAQKFADLTVFPGTSWVVLSEPVPQDSIHRLKMKKGTVIPPHTHPADEYVFVVFRSMWSAFLANAKPNKRVELDSLRRRSRTACQP